MPVAVVTDSTHYLPADVLARHHVHVVSLYVKRGETLERESEISDLDAFYARLRTESDVPTTSQPSVGDFLAAYEPLLHAGRDIVSIHLSGAVSGTYGSALQARQQLAEHGYGDRVSVSTRAAGPQGWGWRRSRRRPRPAAAPTSRTSGSSRAAPPRRRRSGSASTRSSSCVAAGGSAAHRRGSAGR